LILSETELFVHSRRHLSQRGLVTAALYHRVIGGAVEICDRKPFNFLSGNHPVFDALEAIIAKCLRHERKIGK
jgi:hypothetical protein